MSKTNGKTAIPAVGYLRKSTSGQNSTTGRERQEKSIPQQQREIEALAKVRGYRVVRWYADPGISGWKRGAQRPDFQKMLTEAREKQDFKAVLCDDLDRFSRAKVNEVQADAYALSSAGVRFIVTASQGEYDLDGSDIGGIIKFVVDVHGGNEFSRKLARRIALSRRNRANEGKRSGGPAPYGLANDGAGGLTFGDREKMKIVRRIFDEFARQCRSMNSVVASLNAEKIPAPRGGKWSVVCVRKLLVQRAYVGDFVYNRMKSGQFFVVNEAGDVVEADADDTSRSWKPTEAGVIAHSGKYKPLIDPALFAQAQERLTSFRKEKRRPRENGFPLARVLVCDHCGQPMYGCHPTGRKHRVYRCRTNGKYGMGTCGAYEIHEDAILPFVLRMLGREITNLRDLLTNPPDALRFPKCERAEQREALERERTELAAKFDQACENLLFVADPQARKYMDARVTAIRLDLERIDAELSTTDPDPAKGYSADELNALAEWWREFDGRAVSLPLSNTTPEAARYYREVGHFNQDPFADEAAVLVGRREVAEALHKLGAEVRLRWRTDKVTLPSGKEQNRYRLARGRFRLGQKTTAISGNYIQTSVRGRYT